MEQSHLVCLGYQWNGEAYKLFIMFFTLRYLKTLSMKTITIENKTAKELRSHLLKELALFEGVEKRFQKKYKMSLTQLEQKIKTEGVSTEKHEIWEDSIEWRNATEEAAKLRAILAGFATKTG